jgi:hypothetical protein
MENSRVIFSPGNFFVKESVVFSAQLYFPQSSQKNNIKSIFMIILTKNNNIGKLGKIPGFMIGLFT